MKKYYAEGQVPTARQISAAEGEEAVRQFAATTGYPIIAKPDVGVGASGTYKIHDDAELKQFYETEPNYTRYVVEEFITGEITVSAWFSSPSRSSSAWRMASVWSALRDCS